MAWNRSRPASDDNDDLVDDIGHGIGDLRAHLSHAHPLVPADVEHLDTADVAALHRRLHGRAVEPERDLLDVHLVEMRTPRDARQVTSIELDDMVREHDPHVWLPMRITDLVHSPDSPGHTDKGGCRACADIIDATVRAMRELDDAPAAHIARLESEIAGAAEQLTVLAGRLGAVLPDPEQAGPGRGDSGTHP